MTEIVDPNLSKAPTNPIDTGKAYDQISHIWASASFDRQNGILAHNRAIAFTKQRGKALDVGCGCNDRLIDLLIESGFSAEGVDISASMIDLARHKHPKTAFYHEDICEWAAPHTYDFITAWDSWHVPLDQ